MSPTKYKRLEVAAELFLLTLVGAAVTSVLLGVYALASWVF